MTIISIQIQRSWSGVMETVELDVDASAECLEAYPDQFWNSPAHRSVRYALDRQYPEWISFDHRSVRVIEPKEQAVTSIDTLVGDMVAQVHQAAALSDLERAVQRAEAAEKALEDFKRRVTEVAHQEADDREWCGEFDDILEELGLPRRARSIETDVTITFKLSAYYDKGTPPSEPEALIARLTRDVGMDRYDFQRVLDPDWDDQEITDFKVEFTNAKTVTN